MQLSTLSAVLLALSFVLTTIGSALMWHFSYTDEFDSFLAILTGQAPVATVSARSFRYDICYFFFIWISSVVTCYFQRPNLMAITAGLLAAIITFNFSFDRMDAVRCLISGSGLNPILDKTVDPIRPELKKLAAGAVLAYVGAGLSFIASVLAFRPKSQEPKPLLVKASVAFVVLFAFIGCVCIWQSSSTDLLVGLAFNPLRAGLFEATECTTAVGIIFLVGIFCSIDHVMYFAAAISAFYNLSIIDVYLLNEDDVKKDAGAGVVMLWLSAVCIVVHCALTRSFSSYDQLDSSSDA